MKDMVKYHYCLDQIAKVNHIEDIEIIQEDRSPKSDSNDVQIKR